MSGTALVMVQRHRHRLVPACAKPPPRCPAPLRSAPHPPRNGPGITWTYLTSHSHAPLRAICTPQSPNTHPRRRRRLFLHSLLTLLPFLLLLLLPSPSRRLRYAPIVVATPSDLESLARNIGPLCATVCCSSWPARLKSRSRAGPRSRFVLRPASRWPTQPSRQFEPTTRWSANHKSNF